MTLIDLVIVLIVVGVLLWLVNTFIPMDPTIKKILTAVVPNLGGIRIGR